MERDSIVRFELATALVRDAVKKDEIDGEVQVDIYGKVMHLKI